MHSFSANLGPGEELCSVMLLLPLIWQSLGRVRLSYKCLSESFTFLSHLVPHHKRVYIAMFSEVSTQHSTRY